MSIFARIYVSLVVIIGLCVTVSELSRWESQDLARFFSYLVLSILASRLKVVLPAITGTLSVLFIFILFGIVELSFPKPCSWAAPRSSSVSGITGNAPNFTRCCSIWAPWR
jgi:uncharacterized membrane protein